MVEPKRQTFNTTISDMPAQKAHIQTKISDMFLLITHNLRIMVLKHSHHPMFHAVNFKEAKAEESLRRTQDKPQTKSTGQVQKSSKANSRDKLVYASSQA